MQEGVAVVLEQLDVQNFSPRIVCVRHDLAVDLRQGIHAAAGARNAVRLLRELLHLVHDAGELVDHVFVLVAISGGHIGGEADTGVVADVKGGVQRVVVPQEADFVTLGADALAKDNLLVKDRRDFDFNVVAQLDLERNVYSYLEAAALQVIEPSVRPDFNLYLVPVEVDLRFAAAGACIDAVQRPHDLRVFHALRDCGHVRNGFEVVALAHNRREIGCGLLRDFVFLEVLQNLAFDFLLLLFGNLDLLLL